MNASRHLSLSLPLVLLLLHGRSQAQCLNEDMYPDFAVTPSIVGAPTQISDCVTGSNYSDITDIVAGATYKFVTDPGSYITVRQDTYDGAVLGAGYSPLLVVAATAGDLFPHFTVDDQCDQDFNCILATVQAFLTCSPPIATVTTVDDCATNSFTVSVDLTSTGDGGTVTLEYDVNDGTPVSIPGVGVGEFSLGPFVVGDVVDLTVAHETDASCNQTFDDLVTQGNCPFIVDCGGTGLSMDFCYENNDAHHWTFQSSGGQAMLLAFSAGSLESVDYDQLTIYNGPDNTAPILYQHVIHEQEDLTGISVVGGPTLYMEMASDGFGSCGDGNQQSWSWTLQCVDCYPPAASYSVVTDCATDQYTVNVDITDMGTDPVLDIGNDAGAPVVNVPSTGTYSVGPIPVGTPVVVTVVNDMNDLCSVHSAPLINTVCPIISCGPDEYSYCYGDDDHTYWVYQSSSSQPIGLEFLAGSIYPFDGDVLRVYDGLDQSAPLLYEGTNDGNPLTGLQWISTDPDNALTLEISSDFFTSCAEGFGDADEWHYVVACYDGCTAPAATFSPLTDCANGNFSIGTTITDMGTAPSLTIGNDGGAAPVMATAPGTYTSGPFPLGTPVVITVQSTSALCDLHSVPLLNPICPDTVHCGQPAIEETYCYPDNDHHEWHWASDGSQPLALVFSSGSLESASYDQLTIYDGPNDQSPILYQHGFDQEDLSGLFVASTGTDLYMEMSSDGIVSCEEEEQTTWNWTVGCLDCTNPVADFQVVPDCTHNNFNVAVTVSSLGTASSLRLESSLEGLTMDNVGVGTTLFGPFPLDSTTTVVVYNSANSLCRIFSQPMTYATADCVIPSCAAATYEHCYTNNDTAWFMYQSSEGEPLTINFLWGQLLTNDYVQIYNGIGTTATTGAQIIYMGNHNGDMTGFAINSFDGTNALTMLVISNASGSCADGDALTLHWVVGCGEVGIDELAPGDFAMYPNPTTGELYIRLPEGINGLMDLRVIDVAGRQVRHQAFTAQSGVTSHFDLEGLQDGNYTVLLTTQDRVKAQQLQIIR